MIKGERVALRRMRDDDVPTLEAWAEDPDALWGPFQRFELDRVGALKEAYEKTGLLSDAASKTVSSVTGSWVMLL